MPIMQRATPKTRIRYSRSEVDWFRYVALLLLIANIVAISSTLTCIQQVLERILQGQNYLVQHNEFARSDIAADIIVF